MAQFEVGGRVRVVSRDSFNGAVGVVEEDPGTHYVVTLDSGPERLTFGLTELAEITEDDTPTAIDPGHYKFGDVEVRQISGHLTSFGGQALQYIARATRLDGNNKGDAIEDLKKSLRFIQWEIERLEGK